MVLTAESGWSFGDIGYGEPKMAELRAVIDEHRAENGKPPIDWTIDDQVEADKAKQRDASRGTNPVRYAAGWPHFASLQAAPAAVPAVGAALGAFK